MSEFLLFLRMGVDHVTEMNNTHHIFFLLSLFAIYPINQWVKIIILLTAFSLGHILSLLPVFLGTASISADFTVWMIPGLILLSAIMNFLQKSDKFKPGIFKMKYSSAIIFGFLNGTRFYQGLFKIPGSTVNHAGPLFSYNLGVELAQIFIVVIIVVVSLLFTDILKMKKREWQLTLTGIASGAAIVMLADHFSK
jgi:hypothetical protein